MAPRQFTGAFTQQEPIGDTAIAAAVEVMKTGRLHRYNQIAGEQSQVSLLEAEYAAYQEQSYCLACASGGYAMHIALLAAGMQRGEPVLTNAFTLSPVPGAIVNAGGKPVLVECTRDLVIDLDDLDASPQHQAPGSCSSLTCEAISRTWRRSRKSSTRME